LLAILNLACEAGGFDLFQQFLEKGGGRQPEVIDEVAAGQ